MHSATPWRTYAKLLAVAAVWGASWVAGRFVVNEASPFAIASWRFLMAAAVLGAMLVRQDGRMPWANWQREDWLGVAALGMTGILLYNLCFFYGLRLIEAGRGALVVALTPAVIAIADWLLFGATMTLRRGGGIAVAMIGCLLVVTHGDIAVLLGSGIGRGELLILGCVIFWSAYTFIGRRVSRRISPLAATFGASLTGGAMLTVGALAEGSLFAVERLSPTGIGCIVFLGLFVTALSFTWYAEAVRDLGATRAGMFINLVPVFGVLLGAWLLHERLTAAALAGGGLVIIGVASLNISFRRVPKENAA